MLTILIATLHVIVCLFLILVVLLQQGKSADIAATFGGQASQTAFGPRGAATVLTKATTWAAIIFMLTSITLSVFASRRAGTGSVLEGVQSAPSQSAPAQNTPPPGAPGNAPAQNTQETNPQPAAPRQ